MPEYHLSNLVLAISEAMHEADNYFVSYDQARAAMNFALEEAALVADDIANDMLTQISKEHGPWMKAVAKDIAAAIRALKE